MPTAQGEHSMIDFATVKRPFRIRPTCALSEGMGETHEQLLSSLTRIDLHCHSSASRKPVNRAVGLLTNMPESYSPP
ncbi:MAG: hypothetical protein ACNA8P_03430, partial [Phycisphaerales bacterium]